jgi:flavorubredoxin
MAEAIASGIKSADSKVTVKVLNSAKRDKNDIITEVFRSKAILVGSPTINKGILFSIAGILEVIHGLQFKGKKAAAFGAYGWSGESVKIINKRLQEAGFEIVSEGIRELWKPDSKSLEDCHDFGEKFAKACRPGP